MERLHTPVIQSFVIGQQSITAQVLWICGFALLTAVGAQLEIPHQPVPYTLQTFFVLMSGALLGKRNGALSQLLYLMLGLVGLPVFSGWGFGLARLLGPTGGYLFSFPVAAFVVGYLIDYHRSFLWHLMSMAVGVAIVFSLGIVQLYAVYSHNWAEAIAKGFFMFSWWDALKLFAAATIYHQISSRLQKS
ncbi:MAG: biotin transporter BioY [Ignavibacteriae bacterium]|nr:biotin transporter BioY [Ignavibacteriota bacterium]